jgi:hypothetical protein
MRAGSRTHGGSGFSARLAEFVTSNRIEKRIDLLTMLLLGLGHGRRSCGLQCIGIGEGR